MPRLVIFGRVDLSIKADLAHHWSVKLVDCEHNPPCAGSQGPCLRSHDGIWYEVDGYQLTDPKNYDRNSINGGKDGDYNKPGHHQGKDSKLSSIAEVIVGATDRSYDEIHSFNIKYLKKNPTYNILKNNCQNYADALCDYLCHRKGVLSDCGIYLENLKDGAKQAGVLIYENSPSKVKKEIDEAYEELHHYQRKKEDIKRKLHGCLC